MASGSYHIKALANSGTQLKLHLEIISPDEYYFYDKKNFALQIIWEAAQLLSKGKAPILKAISEDQILDTDWVLQHENDYITNVTVTDTKNQPDAAQIDQFSRAEWDAFRSKNGTPSAVYTIDLKDKSWGSHIQEGQVWETASYDYEN